MMACLSNSRGSVHSHPPGIICLLVFQAQRRHHLAEMGCTPQSHASTKGGLARTLHGQRSCEPLKRGLIGPWRCTAKAIGKAPRMGLNSPPRDSSPANSLSIVWRVDLPHGRENAQRNGQVKSA